MPLPPQSFHSAQPPNRNCLNLTLLNGYASKILETPQLYIGLKKFFQKRETPQKILETLQKKEETTQLIEVLLKDRNSSTFSGKVQKKEETPQLNELFKKN